MKHHIETEVCEVEANGWVEAGAYYSAYFTREPQGVKGCPLGRSQRNMASAIQDLVARTNQESGTTFTVEDLVIVRENGVPVEIPE